MINSLKLILIALFGRKNNFNNPNLITISENTSTVNAERCQRILNYWLDN